MFLNMYQRSASQSKQRPRSCVFLALSVFLLGFLALRVDSKAALHEHAIEAREQLHPVAQDLNKSDEAVGLKPARGSTHLWRRALSDEEW